MALRCGELDDGGQSAVKLVNVCDVRKTFEQDAELFAQFVDEQFALVGSENVLFVDGQPSRIIGFIEEVEDE